MHAHVFTHGRHSAVTAPSHLHWAEIIPAEPQNAKHHKSDQALTLAHAERLNPKTSPMPNDARILHSSLKLTSLSCPPSIYITAPPPTPSKINLLLTLNPEQMQNSKAC